MTPRRFALLYNDMLYPPYEADSLDEAIEIARVIMYKFEPAYYICHVYDYGRNKKPHFDDYLTITTFTMDLR